jgi:NAD+ kinase
VKIVDCIVVRKETALSQSSRAARFASRGDATAKRLIHAHNEHHRTVEAVRKHLARRGVAFREIVAHQFTSSEKRALAGADLVVTVGGDGTLLGASHYVTKGAMIGVNSAPRDSIGHFCSARRSDLAEKLDEILASRLKPVRLARLAVILDERQLPELALNDVLIAHQCPAATTRYIIKVGDLEEEHRSSGLWISTAMGSTAGIRSAGGRVMPHRSRRIQYLTRELYREPGRSYKLIREIIGPAESLTVASKMPEGELYIDGARTLYPFPFGARAEIKLADLDLKVFLKDRAGD